MNVEENIKRAVASALSELGVRDVGEIPLEHPKVFGHGDYTTFVALRYAKQQNFTIRDFADDIYEKLNLKPIEGVAHIELEGPGFINFYLDQKVLANTLQEIIADPTSWGRNDLHERKKIMVEYTDPNPFKEFHIGHLVPNTLGESLTRLFEFASAEVKRANYQGDVGIHVAKSLFILLEKGITDPTIADLSTAYPEGSARYDEDEEAKKVIDALNKKIYDKSDDAVNSLYEKGRKLSLEHFEEIYKILGTKFDFYFFESATGPLGVEVVRAHPELFVESEGATVFKGEEYGLHTRVFLNKLGLPTYEAKDLGLARLKEETYPFDLTLTITGNEQGEYFKVVKKAMELALPELAGKIAYKTNGMLRFAEGKMSSRTGNIIRGEDLLEDLASAAKERAAESASRRRADDPEALAMEIAVAAIKYQILKQGFGKDIIFDRERALSLEGDSGPYLQYTYARTSQILARAQEAQVYRGDASIQIPSSAENLVRLMYRFPGTVERAVQDLEPHTVANYLIEFAAAFNRWYAEVRIVDGEDAPHKVAITEAARITLHNGLYLLGIPAPEKM